MKVGWKKSRPDPFGYPTVGAVWQVPFVSNQPTTQCAGCNYVKYLDVSSGKETSWSC
jgi:hypothetical protein